MTKEIQKLEEITPQLIEDTFDDIEMRLASLDSQLHMVKDAIIDIGGIILDYKNKVDAWNEENK